MTAVRQLDWRRSQPQVWYDGWRNTERVCNYYGKCVLCGTRCYGFTDGENDPRGVLGDHAVSMQRAEDYDMQGDDVVACFMCADNDEARYHQVVALAKRQWTTTETGSN